MATPPTGRPVGRPLKVKSPEEFDSRVDEYFEKCFDLEVRPTRAGMVLALGFCSKTQFYDYEKRPEFKASVRRARMLIEEIYEQMLGTSHAAGPIFALKNMAGWSDQQEIKHSGGVSHGVALLPDDADPAEYMKNAIQETTEDD